MLNKKVGTYFAPLLVLLLILLVFILPGTTLASQLYISELLDANPPHQVPKEGPIVRITRLMPLQEAPASPEPAPRPPVKKVALTFDDGPELQNTSKILEILKTEQILATFFVVGYQVERYPNLLKRIFNEGHLIANHSRTHADFATLTNEDIISLELGPTSQVVEKLTGFYPMIMRPPYGSLRADSVRFLNESGWRIVRWSLDTFDWDGTRNTTQEIVRRILEQHHPNAIVLMHCNGPATTKALPEVISTLRNLGYEFVTVNQL